MNKTCTVNVLDEVNCRIGGLQPEDLQFLWEKYGIHVDGYFHMPAYQLRRWDGKIRFFEKTGNTFTKLLDEIVPHLVNWGYGVNLEDNRPPAPVITDRIDENFFNLDWFKLRPYQVEVVNALLEEGSGFAICATGAGKTSMCAALATVLYLNGLQTLVIVPSSDLVTQTVEDFRSKLQAYPITVGEYSGGQKDIDHPIVVATWQALQNVPHYMQFFQAVIVDEAHGVKANVIKELVNVHGKHISHRYGCTGTFPKPVADQYNLKLSIGKIVREVTARWLMDNGYLAEIEILPVETQDEDPDLPDYASERAYLTKHGDRNVALAKLIQELREKHGNTLVLVNTQGLQAGRDLVEMIPGSVYLDGDSKKGVRRDYYDQYATSNDQCGVVSAGIAAVGIDLPRIFCEVLLDAGKSFVKCIQGVGRSLRMAEDKKKVIVVDVYSKLKYSKKHYKERVKYYKEAEYPLLDVRKLRY